MNADLKAPEVNWVMLNSIAKDVGLAHMWLSGRTSPSIEDTTVEREAYVRLVERARNPIPSVSEVKAKAKLAREQVLIEKRVLEEIPAELEFSADEIMLLWGYIESDRQAQYKYHRNIDGEWRAPDGPMVTALRTKLERMAKFLQEQCKRLTAAAATNPPEIERQPQASPELKVIDSRKCLHGLPIAAKCKQCEAHCRETAAAYGVELEDETEYCC